MSRSRTAGRGGGASSQSAQKPRDSSDVSSFVSVGARLIASRARTVFEGVIFFALASAFIALRVSLSPFASRYASTAGTRSAALALIATVGGRLRRAATRCEPSPKPWRRFREKRATKRKKRLFVLGFCSPHYARAFSLAQSKIKNTRLLTRQTSFRKTRGRGRATRVTRVRFRGRNRASSKSSSFSRKRALST